MRLFEMAFFTGVAEGAYRKQRFFNIASIVFSAAVPIIALLPGLWGGETKAAWVISLAGIAGALATLCKSIDGFSKNKEKWLHASALLARLRSEKFLFETEAGKYADPAQDRVGLFASSVDDLINQETDSWTSVARTPQAPPA